MSCNGCLHNEDGKCTEKACTYIHIKESILRAEGFQLNNNIWLYNGNHYKIIGFEFATNEFICVPVRV